MKTLLFLVGPPAVGKMTVGKRITELTGLPLFHNHLSIEAVLPVFEFGTEPFGRLVTGFREAMIREVLESDLPGMIFTYVWAFDDPGDLPYVKRIKDLFEESGGRVVFAELQADLEVRLIRNEAPERLASKPSKRDVVKSRRRLLEAEEQYTLRSGGAFPFDDHILIDTTRLSPDEVARTILGCFDLPKKDAP